MIPPQLMCRKHLLGEHVELHMLVGTLQKGKSIRGYLEKKLVDPCSIETRHNALVREMLSRGYKHNSLLWYDSDLENEINIANSILELSNRCQDCRSRIIQNEWARIVMEY